MEIRFSIVSDRATTYNYMTIIGSSSSVDKRKHSKKESMYVLPESTYVLLHISKWGVPNVRHILNSGLALWITIHHSWNNSELGYSPVSPAPPLPRIPEGGCQHGLESRHLWGPLQS